MTKARDLADNTQNAKPKIVDAKGDLIAATAADTVNRLAVGANGETLVADSSTSTGLRYQSNFAAGKNKIINGDMSIWQRGTSATMTNNTHAFGPDRYRAYVTFSAGTTTFAQQTFTPGAAPVAGYEGQYFARLTCGSTSTYAEISQKIEDVRTLAGQTATLSFWAKSSAAIVFTPYLIQQFGSGGSGDVATAGSNVTLTTSWVRYTATISVPSITGKTIGTNGCLLAALAYSSGTLNSATIDLWGVQVEAGSVATAFQTATGTIQGELAACQRYCIVYSGDNTIGNAPASSTTAVPRIPIATPAVLRTTPTMTISGTLQVFDGVTATNVSTLGTIYASQNIAQVQANVASGLTQYRNYSLFMNSGSLTISAELQNEIHNNQRRRRN